MQTDYVCVVSRVRVLVFQHRSKGLHRLHGYHMGHHLILQYCHDLCYRHYQYCCRQNFLQLNLYYFHDFVHDLLNGLRHLHHTVKTKKKLYENQESFEEEKGKIRMVFFVLKIIKMQWYFGVSGRILQGSYKKRGSKRKIFVKRS